MTANAPPLDGDRAQHSDVGETAQTDGAHVLRQSDRRFWRRHPGDVARLVWRGAGLAILLALTAAFPTAVGDISVNLIKLFAQLPSPVRYALIGLAQILIVAIPIGVVVWLFLRRSALEAAMVIGAAVFGGVLMMLLTDWLVRAAPAESISGLPSSSFLPTDFPSPAYLAALVAGAATASPLMPDQWRRVAWGGVLTAALVRFLSATQTPVNVLVTIALGGVVGSAVLVAFGSPRRRPGAVSLRADLATGGFEVDDLHDETEHAGRRSYRGTSAGREIEVVYIDRDDRDVDLLARVVRTIRVRDVDEQGLSVRPTQRVQHQAVVTMLAEQAGARVPKVYAVVPAERESALIALDAPSGSTLQELQADDITDVALDDLWTQLQLLHTARIAHRSLTRSNLVVDGDEASLFGLENARLVAGDDSCAVDAAELLVSTSLAVGTERAVAAALRAGDHGELQAALAFIQPPALPPQTRKAAKKPKGFVADVRTALQTALGVDQVELAEMERVSIPKALTWVGFGVLAFFLLGLASNWQDISSEMKGLNWWWVVPITVATLLGPVAGAVSMMGSVLRPLALGDTTIIMFGQSFLNRFTPMNAGGMAMRIRYLQKGGTDATVATAAIGLTSAASGVVQVAFMAFFILWSSTDPADDKQGSGSSSSSDGVAGTVVIVVLIAIVLALIVFALTPKLRRWVVKFVKSTISKIRHDFSELARQPAKLGMLFGGAGAGKLLTIVAFVFACRAFDIDLPFAELGALYLIATTIASTVPTPGGVGAIDAALVLVLTNAGVDQGSAWAATLLFRLINYWLPTIPGYIGLKLSQRRELI